MSPYPLCLKSLSPTISLDCMMICSLHVLHIGCEMMKNTGNRFRSYVLGVMSPARFLCAMPVMCCVLRFTSSLTNSFSKTAELIFTSWGF